MRHTDSAKRNFSLPTKPTLKAIGQSKHVIQDSAASSHGLASVTLDLQSSYAYGGVVSDPIEGAKHNERQLLVLRNAAGAQIAQC